MNSDTWNVSTASIVCSICIKIFVKPVTLPCGHEFCLECFKSSVDEVSLQCPVCRKRISVWIRRRKFSDDLVNEQKWHYIQENFKDLIDGNEECIDDQLPIRRSMSSSGELRKEYLEELSKVNRERSEQKQEEERKSMQFIETLLSEEASNREFIADEMVARQLYEEQYYEQRSDNKYNLRQRKQVNYNA